MGDIANMTDNDGRVNGHRLLRWLGRRAEMASQHLAVAIDAGDPMGAARQRGKLEVLLTMANDLAAELTPPSYPGDDSDTVDLGDLPGGIASMEV